MKAVRIHAFGDPDVLTYEATNEPTPGPDQVRIKVAVVGLNFIDTYHRKGLYPGQLPRILGGEAAGIIDAVGTNVTDLKPGDRVVSASVQGSYAEYALAAAMQVVQIPNGISFELATAVMLQGLTAHYLAFSTFPLSAGDTALVHAAGGGVGRLLTQIAKRRGARVIGTASTSKIELARSGGADAVIDYTKEDFAAETKHLTNGKGVDVVYDSVGKTTFDQSLNSLRPRGYLVLYGQSSGPVAPVDPQILNSKGSLFLTRPTLVHYTATRAELLQRCNDLFSWIAAGELDVQIDKTFALSRAADAHRYAEGRHTKGKVLLIP